MSGAVFHFLRPVWLCAMVPAVALWWSLRHRQDAIQPWRRVIEPALLSHLTASGHRGTWVNPINGLLAAWIVGILIVAGPSWDLAPSLFAGDAPPVMIVLKVAPSMMNQDLPPNRLTRAQQKIADLLALQPSQSAGLIAYAGSAHLVLPPTHDGAIVVSMAHALGPDEMPKAGDDLSGAIALARRILSQGEAGGSILLMADDVAANQLSALRNVPGRPYPVMILAMLPRGQAPGAALRRTASDLNARIVTVTVDPSDVASIGRRIAAIGRVMANPAEQPQWRDRGWYFVPVLALLVMLGFRRGWVIG